ncbi:MAG: hypothetical protein ABEJ59_06275 [Halanaeroarchaeum sp.]
MTEMGDISHSHRDDPRNVFGELFRRGPGTATDGGEPAPRTMADVEHESPEGTDANHVWARGRVPGADR